MRVVGQYDDDRQDALRDDSRTGLPLLLRQPDGSYAALAGAERATLRADWLFSYQPNPGTVVFAGYGSTTEDADPTLGRRDLRRAEDGFFVKLSYLFRL